MKFFGLVLTLLAVAVGPTAAEVLTGRVVGVSDGDTITVLDPTKTQHKIRVEGIDSSRNGLVPRQRTTDCRLW